MSASLHGTSNCVVVLSGSVCAGKSTLAEKLRDSYGFLHCRTHRYLEARWRDNETPNRRSLQELGEVYDRRTKGAWVCEALRAQLAEEKREQTCGIVVDAVRIRSQVDALRHSYGRRVVHVHLEASERDLARRYASRRAGRIRELASYREVQQNATEKRVHELASIADVVVDTSRCTQEDVVIRVACHLSLYGKEYLRLVDVLVGGQFGSEGKGQVAAYLAPEYDVLVRVGGPNAGHKVFETPKPYAFHQLPSGCRANLQADVIIGPGAVLRVQTLQKEIAECHIEAERLSIDPQAMIISDGDRLAEATLSATIGSTGQGVGAATARKIMGRSDRSLVLAKNVADLRPYIRETCHVLEGAFAKGKRVFLEGTQGTGLSLHHGWYPHVTSRDTTVAGCLAEAGISPSRARKVIMVCRTYPIRVQNPANGKSGYMSQELSWAEVARRSGLPLAALRAHERTTTTNKRRRVAEFDWALLRKAASLNAPTDIAMTFVDYLAKANRNARRYEQLEEDTIRFIEEVERVAGAPVSLISTRFHSRGVIDRRAW